MNNITVYKDNQLIEASYKLNMIEQRLMLYCIGKLNPTNPDKKQVISVEDFIKSFPDISPGNAYNQIREAIDTIYERSIKVKRPKGVKEFRWIQSKEYQDDHGSAVIVFSDDVMPYLCQLEQQFTKYQLRNVSGFKRTYSIRLYELLTQYRDIKKRSITVEDLRELLGIGGKFQQIKDLKKYVVDSAIEEINSKSDLRVSYTQTKKGRVVYSFEFEIKVDKQIDMFERQDNNKRKIKEIKQKLSSSIKSNRR